MAEEQDTPTPEETAPGLPDENAVAAVEEAAAGESTPEPAGESTPEPAGESTPEPAAQSEPAAPREPVEVLSPQERRLRARAARSAKAPDRGSRTPEERQADRDAERRQKAAARRHERPRSRAKARARSGEGQPTPPREHGPGRQKTRQGVVVSDRAAKTITVRIDVARRHRRYQKIVRTSNTVHAHDEQSEAHIGDTVIVRECRPLSRTKRWRLIEVVERAQ